MNNAIVPFEEVKQIGEVMFKSGYFADSKDAAQAIVKIFAGRELGLGAFASMTGIHIIQGKPALGANLLASLIKNDPRYDYSVVTLNDELCSIQFYENGAESGLSEFTTKDAKRCGTKNMDRFAKNMLFARAISNGARWYAPGIFGGAPVYTPEELGADVDIDGNIIDVTPTVARPTNNAERMEALYGPEPAQHTNAKRSWGGSVITAIKKMYPEKSPPAIVGALNESNLTDTKDAPAALNWYEVYRNNRDAGEESDAAASLTNAVFEQE